ncbi:MAG: SH3 domain-containing protein [Pseudonocardiaceae bacterium]
MAGKSSKRWKWIVGAAAVLAVIVLSTGENRGTGESRPCTMKVTADALNVRSGPGDSYPVVETLAAGEVVSADLTTRNGYRQLGPDRWAAQQYLEPEPGSKCSAPVG